MQRTKARAQLKMIDAMIAEGRRATERWGWIIVMWGVAECVAANWSRSTDQPALPWAAMLGASLLVTIISFAISRHRSGKLSAGTNRLLHDWLGAGVSLAIVGAGGGLAGLPAILILPALYAIEGAASWTSASTLNYPVLRWVAGLWWLAAVMTLARPDVDPWPVFYGVVFLGQIVWGLALMIKERRPG